MVVFVREWLAPKSTFHHWGSPLLAVLHRVLGSPSLAKLGGSVCQLELAEAGLPCESGESGDIYFSIGNHWRRVLGKTAEIIAGLNLIGIVNLDACARIERAENAGN